MSVSILGTGVTSFGRRPDDDLRSLSTEATDLALLDAGITASDLDMVVFGNATEGYLHGQEMIRSEVVLRHAGLAGVPMINVENACASSSSAFHVACMAVSSGAAEVVLVLGAERLTHPTKRRSFDALATAVDLTEHVALASAVGATGAPPEQDGTSHSPLMDLYAAKARSFMERSDVTARDLAMVSVKNRFHGSLNPRAQFRTTVELDEVLASRMISDPLQLLMCSPIGDGAAAVVVASTDLVRRRGKPDVRVAGWALTSNGADERAARPVARAMQKALSQAQVSVDDLDVAEVHDACAPAELWLYEELGLCEVGGAGDLLRSGATRLGGALPVNVGGGLLGRGHPLGATGCAQLVEIADQLRGRGGARQVEGARVGVAQNSGGILDDLDEAVAAVTILALEG
ncbi:thiolase family protein [Aeromicrobium sp.]|uniref:thiolase family protein n=1 Tax=Aeromicrobium sp. TaxID=1871063 RepID=UPI0025BAAECA|nr:thiolase family protein [Aeromicrobium sp.]MCK5892615.1 thiolase family protein [Aeromicrobium sp.]